MHLDRIARKIAAPFLRISLGVILAWIGALKFVDPAPVRDLLEASLPFLASAWIVYLIGVLEVVGALLLLGGIGLRWVGLGLVGLFAGTLLIFLITPAVTYGESGFPVLSLAGEFLLKDLVLMAAAVALMAIEVGPEREAAAVA